MINKKLDFPPLSCELSFACPRKERLIAEGNRDQVDLAKQSTLALIDSIHLFHPFPFLSSMI